MSKSPKQPFARRRGTRLVAMLGIVLAASWGPLSHAFRLIEVCETDAGGKADAQQTVRIVLARGSIFENAPRKKPASPNKSKSSTEGEKSTTERLLNAAPETLDIAQAIHFDLGGVPLEGRISAWLELAGAGTPLYAGRLTGLSASVANAARGPPFAA